MKKYLTPLILFTIVECTSKEDGMTDTVVVNTSVFMGADPSVTDLDTSNYYAKGEMVSVDFLEKDTLLLKRKADTIALYGYKLSNKLLVEGDIFIDYPPKDGKGFGVASTNFIKLWRKNGKNETISYKIDANLPNKGRVIEALQEWENKTNISFKPISGEASFIYFVSSTQGCLSEHLGKKGGEQKIRLGNDCTKGNVVHEIGHILGLFHEQTRSDRDSFIKLNNENIDKYWESQFKLASTYDLIQYTYGASDIGSYNYNSIMHYSPYYNGKKWFEVKKTVPIGIPGQRDSLSRGDIETINSLYPSTSTIQ